MKNKESRVGNMAVRDEIIKTLEENRGTYLSGEQLAKKLSVSRAAVWKAIRKLQEDGFAIEGVNNKGYKLAEDTDVLSAPSQQAPGLLPPASAHGVQGSWS